MSRRLISCLAAICLVGALFSPSVVSARVHCPMFHRDRLYETGSWGSSVAAGHFTRDRRLDVAVATEDYFDPANDYRVFIFRQGRAATFHQHLKLATGVRDAHTIRQLGSGDFNRDGRLDLALTTEKGVLLFFQRSDSSFRRRMIPTPSLVSDLIVKDMDTDGYPDIVIKMNGLQLLLNRKDSWRRVKIDSRGPRLTAVGNLVGRRPDVAAWHQDRGEYWLTYYVQRRDGSFRKVRGPDSSLYGDSLDVSEVTKDGRNDVLLAQAGVVAVYPGHKDGRGLRSRANYYATGDGSGPVVGTHMNNDRRPDIITLHGGWNEVGILCQRRGGEFNDEMGSYVSTPTHFRERGMIVRDLNGDGAKDIAYASATEGWGIAFQPRR